MTMMNSFTPESSKPCSITDAALGREIMYRTSVISTPVFASNRIHTNEIEKGKRKSFLKEDDVNELMNAFDTLCVSPVKGLKKKHSPTRKTVSSRLVETSTHEEAVPESIMVNTNIQTNHHQSCIPDQDQSLSKTTVQTNSIALSDTTIAVLNQTTTPANLGMVETTIFSISANREVTVKRSARIIASKQRQIVC
jgi:hypothetical protein